MHEIPIPPRWFCLRPPNREPQGPFDLLELAALLHTRDISGDTLTQREGESEWITFSERKEFVEALKIPEVEIAQHLKDVADQELAPWWTPRRLYYLVTLVLGSIFDGNRRGNRNRW